MRLKWRFPFWFALGVVIFVTLADWVVEPLHVQTGWLLTTWIGRLARLLEAPGIVVAETGGPRFHNALTWQPWLLMAGSTFVLFLLVGRVLQGLWGTFKRQPPKAPHNEDEKAKDDHTAPEAADLAISRRRFLLNTRRTVVTGLAAGALYGCLGELSAIEVTRRRLAIRNLPAPLRGLKLVQLSDLHHGPWTSLSFIREVIAQANAETPDLILLTGDYVVDSPRYIEPVVKELTALRAKIGVVGTLGNHDWWEDGVATMRAFHAAGIPLIDNNRMFVTGDRVLAKQVGRDDRRHALCLAGVGDLWEGEPNYSSALHSLPDEMPRIVLAHNPDTAEHSRLLKWSPRIDLMLSGHTHGGQISLPGYGPPITLSRYGQKYARGLVQGPICPVYVSRGIGTTVAPIRFGSRPEIAVIEIDPA